MDIQKVLLGSFCLVFPSLEIISHLYPQVLYCPLYKFKLKVSKLVCYCCYRTGSMKMPGMVSFLVYHCRRYLVSRITFVVTA